MFLHRMRPSSFPMLLFVVSIFLLVYFILMTSHNNTVQPTRSTRQWSPLIKKLDTSANSYNKLSYSQNSDDSSFEEKRNEMKSMLLKKIIKVKLRRKMDKLLRKMWNDFAQSDVRPDENGSLKLSMNSGNISKVGDDKTNVEKQISTSGYVNNVNQLETHLNDHDINGMSPESETQVIANNSHFIHDENLSKNMPDYQDDIINDFYVDGLLTLKNSFACPSTRNTTYTLLTIFTTFKLRESKSEIYLNTITLWAQLGPDVRILLYVDEEDCSPWMVLLVQSYGWQIRVVPKRHPIALIPIVRYMFIDAIMTYNSTFFMYANADILFDRTLLDTIHKIEPFVAAQPRILMVGKRCNYDMLPGQRFYQLSDVTFAARAGIPFTEWAMDYFLTTAHGYPWRTVPDFVVGRIRYDNWLLAHALENGLVTIDATSSLLALHQSGVEGSRESLGASFVNINKDMAGDFRLPLARIFCAPLKTILTELGGVFIELDVKIECHRSYKSAGITPNVFDQFRGEFNAIY